MDATIENAIITFQVIEKAAEVIPVAGPPLKATCGIMVLILNAIKVLQYSSALEDADAVV